MERPTPRPELDPRGTRLMASTPQATPTSIAPAAIKLLTKWLDCWEEPHWQSMVVAATSYGRPESNQAVRVTLKPCSPAGVTPPPTTCSTMEGSIPERLTTSAWAAPSMSAGRNPESHPLRLPIGVRTASTMTGLPMMDVPSPTRSGTRPVAPTGPDIEPVLTL